MGMANLSCSPILNQLDADLGSRESSPPGLGISPGSMIIQFQTPKKGEHDFEM
jgi:hypothetical protein